MLKKFAYNELLFGAIINAIFGFLFVFIPVDDMIAFLFVFFGILLIILNIPSFFLYLLAYKNNKENKVKCLSALLSIAIGIVMIFWKNEFFAIIAAMILVVLPIIRILIAPDRKKQLKAELPKLVLGVILFVLGPWGLTNLIFDIVGYIVLFIALLLFIFWVVLNITKPKKNTPSRRNDSNIIDAEVIEK